MTLKSRSIALAAGAALLVGVLGAGMAIGAGASAGAAATTSTAALGTSTAAPGTSTAALGTAAAASDSAGDVVSAALAAFDQAGTADPANLAAPDASAQPRAGIAQRIRQFSRWKQLVHATLTVNRPSGGIQTFDLDHGTITTLASGSITIAEAGGSSVTLATNSTTRVRKDRQKASVADLRSGDEVIVVSRVAGGGTPNAILVVVPPTAPKAATP